MGKIILYICNIKEFYSSTIISDTFISPIAPMYVNKYKRCSEANNEKSALQELTAGYLLSKFLGVHEDEQIIVGEHGKPMLRNGEYNYNLSHSGDYVVLAVADYEAGNVGVDIEQTNRLNMKVAKKLFSEQVVNELERLKAEDDLTLGQNAAGILFAKHWTTCEARLKLSGIGIAGYESINCEYHENDYDIKQIVLDNCKYIVTVAINSDFSTCELSEKIVKCY